jgi:hypothetical protein
MKYGSTSYRLEQIHRHLDEVEGQLHVTPAQSAGAPEALDLLAERLLAIREQVLFTADYSRTCRERKAEAEASVDMMLGRAA